MSDEKPTKPAARHHKPPGALSNRLTDGRFKDGVSGNPTGRPKSETAAFRAQLVERAPEVLAVVLAAALKGDMQAAKLILERVSPPLKAHAAPVIVDLPQPESIAETGAAFIRAAAAGLLPPDLAAQLVAAVGTLARVIEIDELKARLEALERATKKGNRK